LPLNLSTENRVRVIEIRVLREIFEPKGKEVTGAWIKFYVDGRHNLFSSQNIIKVIK